ncbi:LPXTG cell wall anchor domain-containing protein [Streptomyces benahoarensis]|uniref:LPXTG cell wall anchor domain-containing protein n=1 Tax=Streptomyces benahoarensis TaxID=2595054 RepID=A0A553YS05_9ACTN|nr:LPXTG cell wall anchor domain-containing protein [Streptomyces benahoarensis]TSB16896.1 LPXTG cell wall anchor domain-containing protein [Streptomyces benahoarensis]TSB31979.1 LPXTG cell wall anchor domain-containing protein [Streptomyces benahoarensis]
MKIRRALTAAAAAAVIAPAAVLAAPAAAFATEPVSEAGPRTPASPDSPDAATPADRTADSATSGPAPGKAPKAAGTTERTNGAGGATGGGKDAGDADGAGQSCAFESDQLQVAVHGLPRQLAAGGAWTPFSMTLTNTTGKPLEKVQPFLYVSSAEDVDRPYWELETEYRDAKTGRWKTFHDAEPDDLFGFFAVGPRSTLTLQLRTRMVKDAKPGAGYALAAGDYRNRDGSCGSAKEAWYDFTLLPAGAKPTQPPATEPGEPGKPGGTAEPGRSGASGGGTGGSGATGGTGPQGGGHLATTGSSSALPAIALAGGAAMVVGAGAVIVVRRRKGMAGPGATDVTA